MKVSRLSELHGVARIKALVYGRTGVGKTPLSLTAPSPLILATENGTLSLVGADKPDALILEAYTYPDIKEALQYIETHGLLTKHKTFVVDSVTRLAELMLQFQLEYNSHKKHAYGEMATDTLRYVEAMLAFDTHIVMLAKEIRTEGDYTQYIPAFPGRVLPDAIPGLFDQVLRMESTASIGKTEQEGITGYPALLRAAPTVECDARDRSGRLNATEAPDLGAIFNKILNGARTDV